MSRNRSYKPRKTPKQQRALSMVNAILDATAQVLVEVGYDYMTTNKVAAKAGISIGSLYQYYPNKEALVAALNTRLGTLELEIIRKKFREIEDHDIGVAVREVIKAMVDLHRLDPPLHRVLVEQVPRLGDLEKINDTNRQILELMRSYLAQKFADGNLARLDLVLFVVFNVVETLTHQAVLYRSDLLRTEELTDEICALVELYIRARLEKAPA
jgi:AcrR family transcriptional regulator